MGQQANSSKTVRILSNAGAILAVGALGLLATGCSFGTTSNTPPKQIQVRIWRIDQGIDPVRDLINDFKGSHANTKITYEDHDFDSYEFSSLKSLAGRLGPDVWSIPSDWLGDYQDQVQPLPDKYFASDKDPNPKKPAEYVKDLYPAGIVQQITSADGTKVYGLPTNVDSLQLYVNSDLMSQAAADYRKSLGDNANDDTFQPIKTLLSKPPVTWDNLAQQAKYISIRSGSGFSRSTIALGTANNTPDSADILQLLMLQNGTKIISDDHKNPLFHVIQSTPSGGQLRPGQNALEFYTSFADPSKSTYSWNPSMPEALDSFGQGKVAMVIAYSDFAKQLKVKYPKFSYDIAPVPQISAAQPPVNFLKFNIETVTKTADSTATAFDFLKVYTTSSSARNLAREQKLSSPFTADINTDSVVGNEMATGKVTYKLNHTAFDVDFRQMIIDVSQNGISSEEALKGAADKIDGLLNPNPSPVQQ